MLFFFLSSFFVILHATKVRNNCFGENAISDENNLRCVFRPTLRTAFNIARLLLVRWPRLRFSLSLSFSPVFHSFPVEKGRERVAQMAFYSCLAGDTVLCHDRRSMRCRNVIDTFCHVWSGGMIIHTMRRVRWWWCDAPGVAIGVRGKKKKKNGNLCKSYSWIGRALYYVEKLYGDSVAVNPLRQYAANERVNENQSIIRDQPRHRYAIFLIDYIYICIYVYNISNV